MASNKPVLILLSLLTLSSIVIIKPSHAVDFPMSKPGWKIAVYWGQNNESSEGPLTEACDSNLYNIVAIAYLHVSGNTTSLNLEDHCPLGNCSALASQIQHCQSKGIQVFLSVEVDAVDDPTSLAQYLYDSFLSGKLGPLGAVTLDGIDLAHIEDRPEPWDELVRAINGSTQDKKIYISGAPHCSTSSLDSAIDTGLFDYLWVLYYGPSATCEYLGNNDFTNLLNSWAKWTSKPGLVNSSVFLGLVASNETSAASYGYIPPEELKSKVLPTVTESSNFGGVMLWNRYYDKKTGYSTEIKDALGTKVFECARQVLASRRFNSLLAKSV
ncbi:acidic endochitinase-like [Neltuma alba]|uniref:acidic endochitinase-like n=1 Tax=Neltuma alba TaxID=207710 RepID=UPI0010A529D9|nr:acidic endochitinase-like [Prosopis alba]XP_028785892.1 acidic endochitinase-like [Prosopis alba]XP_028785913.1 acidic endochitinase-like [Prosopis alba]